MNVRKNTTWILSWSLIASITVVCILLLYGFTKFIETVNGFEQDDTISAQGIVVLTGESSRIRTGIELLERKKGQKLLISGVLQNSLPNHLNTLKEQKPALFACCIELGFTATNTVGNALEIQSWAEKQKFTKIIVVTSGYHMPRAMLELHREMPNIHLIPYRTKSSLNREIWNNPDLLKRFGVEYFKYIIAFSRAKLEGVFL